MIPLRLPRHPRPFLALPSPQAHPPVWMNDYFQVEIHPISPGIFQSPRVTHAMTCIWYPGTAVHITLEKFWSAISYNHSRRKVRTHGIEIQSKSSSGGGRKMAKPKCNIVGIAELRQAQKRDKNGSTKAAKASKASPGTNQSSSSSSGMNEWLFSSVIFHFLSPFSTHDIIIRQL